MMNISLYFFGVDAGKFFILLGNMLVLLGDGICFIGCRAFFVIVVTLQVGNGVIDYNYRHHIGR